MTRLEFVYALREELKGLPLEDIERHVDYYGEMIDDRIEEGMSEEEAVADIGDPKEIAAQILSETPIKKIVKENIKQRRKLNSTEMLLLIATSPLWVPVAVSVVSALVSLCASVFSAVIVLYAVGVSLVGIGIGLAVGAVVQFCGFNTALALLMLGASLICAALGILWFMGCNALAKLTVSLCKKCVLGIKKLILKRRGAQ